MTDRNFIPECFLPLRTSGRHERYEFKDLKDHKFTRDEKWFLCELIDGVHSLLLPPIEEQSRKTANSLSAWAKRFNLSDSTVRGWQTRYHTSKLKMADSVGGRPRNLDHEAIKTIENHGAVPLNDIDDVFHQQYRESMKRRGKYVEEVMKLPTSSLQRIKEQVPMKETAAQTITKDRYNAIHDIRLVYKIAAIVYAFSNHLEADFKWNMDATTIKVSKSFDQDKEKIMVTFHNAGYKERIIQDDADSHCVFIKWFHFCSAAGIAGPLALIIAVDSIPEGEYYVERVQGMKHDTIIGSPDGWLYAAKDRAGNAAMWKHFFMNVIIPTLRANKAENLRDGVPVSRICIAFL